MPENQVFGRAEGGNSNNEMDRWREREYLLLTFDGNYH